jgi:hypothetical protein
MQLAEVNDERPLAVRQHSGKFSADVGWFANSWPDLEPCNGHIGPIAFDF